MKGTTIRGRLIYMLPKRFVKWGRCNKIIRNELKNRNKKTIYLF